MSSVGFLSRLAVVAACVTLGGCSSAAATAAPTQGGASSAAATAAPTQGASSSVWGTDTLNVDLVGPFSGGSSAFGVDEKAGLELALEPVNYEVNGHKVVVQYVDDQCQPDVAVTQVAKILDSAQMIIGPNCSGDVLAVEDAIASAGIPEFHLGALFTPMTKGHNNLFMIPPSDKTFRAGLIQWAKQNKNVTKWAVLHDTSGYGAAGAQVFVQDAQAAGMTVTANVSYNDGEKDFTGILTNLDKSGADGIDLIGYDTDLAQIDKTAKQLGTKTPIYGDIDYNTKVFLDAAQGSAEGQNFVSYFTPGEQSALMTSFIAGIKSKGADTAGETACGYVSGLVLVDALKRIDGPVTKSNLITAISQTNIAESPLGPVAFGPDGSRTGTDLTIIGQIVNGVPTFITRL
jgi:branched-chain amino acid transport system substrate-binding protein